MQNNLAEILTAALLGFAVGVVAGQFISFRRVRHNGDPDKLKIEIEKHPLKGPLGGKIFRLSLLVLFLAATGLMVNFTVTQRTCNAEFRRTIAERAQVSVDDNMARKENDQAVGDLFDSWLQVALNPPEPPSVARERFIESLAKAVQTYGDNTARQEENERKRAANPYPRC